MTEAINLRYQRQNEATEQIRNKGSQEPGVKDIKDFTAQDMAKFRIKEGK